MCMYIFNIIYIHTYIHIHTHPPTYRESKRSLSVSIYLSIRQCSRCKSQAAPLPCQNPDSAAAARDRGLALLGLYTILPSPIWYGVWNEKGGSVGGRILRNGRAIVLQ